MTEDLKRLRHACTSYVEGNLILVELKLEIDRFLRAQPADAWPSIAWFILSYKEDLEAG